MIDFGVEIDLTKAESLFELFNNFFRHKGRGLFMQLKEIDK